MSHVGVLLFLVLVAFLWGLNAAPQAVTYPVPVGLQPVCSIIICPLETGRNYNQTVSWRLLSPTQSYYFMQIFTWAGEMEVMA